MKVKKNTAPINKKREITQKDIQENNQKYQDVKDFVNDNKIMENIAKANIKKPIDQSHSVAASAHLKKKLKNQNQLIKLAMIQKLMETIIKMSSLFMKIY